MPYIITTTQSLETDVQGATDSRIAVATLEEARKTASHTVMRASVGHAAGDWRAVKFGARELPESGDTVGPLPDGTVIEVRAVSWMDLKIHTDLPGDPHGLLSESTILDAFNAVQA